MKSNNTDTAQTGSSTRRWTMGAVFLILGLITWFGFAQGISGGTITSFGMNAIGATNLVGDWLVPSRLALAILAAIPALGGIYQLARGFQRWTNWVLALSVGCFIFAFLIWAAAGKSLNLASLIATTLGASVPLTLGALSGVISERGGVVNIAIEGMMLTGAMVASWVGSVTGSLWIALLAAILASMLMALIHGVLSIKYKTNQIVSGTVINIFATGLTTYLSKMYLQTYQNLNSPGTFPQWSISGLSNIPFIGTILFRNNIFTYGMFVLLIVMQVVLFSTRWGLRLRATGEHPRAADTLGINVIRTRYMAVLLSGVLAGFAGAYFSIGSVGRFDDVMTAGRGFISLAAMIFGNWTPFGSFGAGLLFGLADSLATRLAILNVPIPSQFLLMAPYVATMIVLAGIVGRSVAPAADGVPYEKE
jgi:simple sugar transport system permease protein